MHPFYDVLLKELRTDLSQMLEEGHDEAALQVELDGAAAKVSVDALLALQEEWWRRPSPPHFPYEEPSDWEAISSFFPDPEAHAKFTGTDDGLADKILAAWQGRCIGCQLGKPLEGTMWPDKIRKTLEIVGSWPLADYMRPTPEGFDPQAAPDCRFFEAPERDRHTRGNFDAVSPDDDIQYALLSQKVLEEHGPAFTSEDCCEAIVAHTPPSMVFASGRNMFRTWQNGLRPPHTALYGNPCRQSLGAMIRCDPWGWGAPANPALAAQMAYKDAVNSQTRNGIYSGIFFAVLMADTLAHGDPARAIDTAASYVPPRSRFAEMVRLVREWCGGGAEWQEVNARIYERYPQEADKFNHSIPNAAIVLLGLLTGGGDFSKTICTTVMAGLDTDCTGATAGSIMGCALGTAAIPAHWTRPLHNTIRTELRGMHELKITEVAERMYGVARQNARRGGK